MDVPGEDWGLIHIKKRLYETDDLVKARKKARDAEIESDLLTDEPLEETSSCIRRSKRRKKLNIAYSPETSDDEDSLKELKDKNLQNKIPNPPSSSLSGVQNNEIIPLGASDHLGSTESFTTRHLSQLFSDSSLVNYSEILLGALNQPSPCSSRESFTSLHPQPINTPKISRNGSGPLSHSGLLTLISKIQNLTETVKENNRLLNSLSVEKEHSPLNDVPFCLPLKSMEDVDTVENFLKDLEIRKKFVTHLAVIGGVNAEKHVRRILCTIFTNDLAQNFNWIGKGEKRSLKETIFPSIIIEAVKRNKKLFAGTTICELENTIKQWFCFSKDRSGGREKRRVPIRENSQKV